MAQIIETLRRALAVPTEAELARAYLEDASDLVDLEFRQREIDRGIYPPRPRFPAFEV